MDRNKVQQFMLKVIGDVGASVTAGLVFIGHFELLNIRSPVQAFYEVKV